MRYVTLHPVGHEPADSLVLAGVLHAVWAVHEVPLLLDRQADGTIVVADSAPRVVIVETPAPPTPPTVEDEPEPEAPAPAPALAAVPPTPPARTGRKGPAPKVTDEQLVTAVRDNGPIGVSALCSLVGLSAGTMHVRLTRLAAAGRVENAGRAWRIPQTRPAPAAPAPRATAGNGIDPGPMTRRPFNPDAARLRAAGEV